MLKTALVTFVILIYTSIIFGQTNVDDTTINNYYESGLAHIETKNLNQAYTNITYGIAQAKAINSKLLIAKGYINLAQYFEDTKQFVKGVDAANTSLSLFEELDDTLEISNCHYKLGYFYRFLDQYDNALDHYFTALKLNELSLNKKGVGSNLARIGSIYLLTGDYDKARANFKEAIEIFKLLNDEKNVMFNYTSLGASYQKEGTNTDNLDLINTAISYYVVGLDMARRLNDDRSESIFLGNIGSSYRKLKKYDESLEYLFRALPIKIKQNRYTSAAHTYNDISETYIEMNKLAEAKKYALKAIEMSKGHSLHQERYAYYILSNIEFELEEYKNSRVHLDKYHMLEDSIFSLEKVAKINEMQIKYETEKKSLKIKAQDSDIALLREKDNIKNQKILFGIIGLFTAFGMVLLVKSRNKQKHRKKLQEQFSKDLLLSQEEERTRIAKELHDSIGQQLTLIKRKAQNARQDEISSLTNQTLEEVRSISRGLYPVMLKQLGLKESIEQLVNIYDEETNVFFTVDIDDINNCLNDEDSLNLYRFIQEGLTNIIKHADAKAVALTIKKENKILLVDLEDNGKGFNPTLKRNNNSLGLKTISERIRILKGKLQITSTVQTGTHIKVQIPVYV